MVLRSCNYDKTKLLVMLGEASHFIETHAAVDANSEGHPLCEAEYRELQADLEKHMAKLQAAVSGLSKEGKY